MGQDPENLANHNQQTNKEKPNSEGLKSYGAFDKEAAERAKAEAMSESEMTEKDFNPKATKLALTLLDESDEYPDVGRAVAANLSQFLEIGAHPDPLIEKLCQKGMFYDVAHNIDKLVAAGAHLTPNEVADEILGAVEDDENDDEDEREDKERARYYNGCDIVDNVDKFLAAGADPERLIRQVCWAIDDIARSGYDDGDYLAFPEQEFRTAGVDQKTLDSIIESCWYR